MIRLLLVPLIPIFVMLVKSLVEDMMRASRERKAAKPPKVQKHKTKPQPIYDHKWDDDD